MLDPFLTSNTPELTPAEQERLFGCLTPAEQIELASLFWACETPEQRNLIYVELRQWWQEATVGVN